MYRSFTPLSRTFNITQVIAIILSLDSAIALPPLPRWPFLQRSVAAEPKECHRIDATACEHIDMDKIVVDPQIHFGKPCIAGTRIPVQSVLELLNEELSFSDIIRDYYSELQAEDIRACLQYAIALVASEDINLVSA